MSTPSNFLCKLNLEGVPSMTSDQHLDYLRSDECLQALKSISQTAQSEVFEIVPKIVPKEVVSGSNLVEDHASQESIEDLESSNMFRRIFELIFDVLGNDVAKFTLVLSLSIAITQQFHSQNIHVDNRTYTKNLNITGDNKGSDSQNMLLVSYDSSRGFDGDGQIEAVEDGFAYRVVFNGILFEFQTKEQLSESTYQKLIRMGVEENGILSDCYAAVFANADYKVQQTMMHGVLEKILIDHNFYYYAVFTNGTIVQLSTHDYECKQ